MAKQKPKTVNTLTRIETKVPIEKKPKYSEAEMKKVGAGYDSVGFKNSAIDMVRSKMDKFASDYTAENKDIIATESIPSFMKSRIPAKGGKDAWVAEGGYFEPNKRNQTISNTFEKKGPLTGKVGMSISEYGLNKDEIGSYLASPTAGTTERFKKKK